MSYATVCPHCQQWQHEAFGGDCQNGCAARGFATVPRRVKVEGHESERCWHGNRIGERSETQKVCIDCDRIVEPCGNPQADRNCYLCSWCGRLVEATTEEMLERLRPYESRSGRAMAMFVCEDCQKKAKKPCVKTKS